MNPTQIPEDYMDEVSSLRGRRYAFPTLEPKRTALVIVDMQNFFVSAAALPTSLEIIPTISRLADAARKVECPVVWVQMEYRDWPDFMSDVLGQSYVADCASSLVEGAPGFEIHPDLNPAPDDWRVIKNRYSAFLPGASDLASRLREANIDTVIVTGVVTNGCCESTARDAMMTGFRTIMVSDANATVRDDLHLATLMSFHFGFGDVRPASEVMELLGRPAGRMTKG